MHLKALLFIFAVALYGASNAAQPAKERPLTDAQIAQLLPEHQKLVRYMRDLKSKGAAGVKTISFEQAKSNMAISAVYDKSNQPGPMYIAEVMENQNPATVGFRIQETCVDNTQQPRLTEQSIKVDDVKISAYYVCGKGSDGNLHRIYIPRSQAGKDALYSAFLTKQVVFVNLNGTEIPFDTAGFRQAWDEAIKPAL